MTVVALFLAASLVFIGGYFIGVSLTVHSLADDLAELDLQREELNGEWLALGDHKIAHHIACVTPRASVVQ